MFIIENMYRVIIKRLFIWDSEVLYVFFGFVFKFFIIVVRIFLNGLNLVVYLFK